MCGWGLLAGRNFAKMPPKPAARKVAQGARTTSTTAGLRTRPGQTPARKPASVAQSGKGGAGGIRQAGRATGAKKQVAEKRGRELSTKKTVDIAGNCKGTVWKSEDFMARKIQTCYRGYRCRKLLLNLKKKRAEYDQMMEKLQREAYIQVVRLEQQRAEAARKREEEEKRKRQEQARRVTRMLEAAFDGDVTEIRSLLEEISQLYKDRGDDVVLMHQYRLIECTDPNKNSPLSEAGAGGHPDTIRLLITLGANLNTKGQYGRTPLYRAAFGGHVEAVKLLLENGADPRLNADDGETPEQVAAHEAVENVLRGWDIEETKRLLLRLEMMHKKRKEAENRTQKSMENRLQMEVDKAEKEYSAKQKELAKAYTELNKRIHEHDENMATGAVKTDITLATVHDAEELLESVRLAAKTAQERLSQVKLQLRSRRKEFLNECSDVVEEDDADYANVVIYIRELDEVLMKDVGLKIAQSGRWPLIIDPSKQAATFLRYRDTNYLNCCNPKQMEPEVIRMALLGSIRYGKFLVLDLLDVEDLWSSVEQRMELVQKHLSTNIMNKSLITENKYLSLVKQTDGEEYSHKMFSSVKVNNFKLVVLTQLPSLPKELMEYFYVIRIHISGETL